MIFPIKFSFIINPIPFNILPVHSFWHMKLLLHELVPTRFIELKFLITAIIYTEDRVAYASTRRRLQIEITYVTAHIYSIEAVSIEEGVE